MDKSQYLPTSKKEKEILKRRKERYKKGDFLSSHRQLREEKKGPCLRFLGFEIEGEKYGLEETYVAQVFHLLSFTPLPHLPPYIIGITHLGGQVIPILDLATYLNLEVSEKGKGRKYGILLCHKGLEFILAASQIEGFFSVSKEELTSHILTMEEKKQELLLGITSNHYALLDGAKIFQTQFWTWENPF